MPKIYLIYLPAAGPNLLYIDIYTNELIFGSTRSRYRELKPKFLPKMTFPDTPGKPVPRGIPFCKPGKFARPKTSLLKNIRRRSTPLPGHNPGIQSEKSDPK